jgi:hypothetical protein
MQRVMVGVVGGLLLGVAITSLIFLTRPHRSWQEQAARAEASDLGCGLSATVFAGCVPTTSFRRTGAGSWEVRFAGPTRTGEHCFELRTFQVPRQHSCG